MTSAAEFVESLGRLHLLPDDLLDGLRQRLSKNGDAKALARELIDGGKLTAFQANLLLQGRGDELLLGSFVLLDKLGEGGMGTVYRARNWKLDRVNAVKLIRKERLAGPDAVKRFHREIRAAAHLDHVNVVRAYDAAEVNGTHYFAMEYVEGIDLARLVREHGPLPASLACEYIRQAALGLQHAHERGLVHRDIKPANLLLARAKGAGTIKVLDMGLVRQDEVASEHSGTLTQVGMVMGTPDYMAPEQSVSSHSVDGRADLYSLGCTLYFLLTGSVPFPGGSLTEKLLKHQMNQPQPLELRRPDVPAAVADLVYKLMAKKPEERFQTAAELAAHLANLTAVAVDRAPAHRSQRVGNTTRQPDGKPLIDPFWAGIAAEVAEQTVQQKRKTLPLRWIAAAGIALGVLLVIWFAAGGKREQKPDKPIASAENPKVPAENALVPAAQPSPWRSLLTNPGSPPPEWRSSKASTDPKFDVVLENGNLIARAAGHGGWNCTAAPRMNYHLRLEFRWLGDTAKRLDVKYHARGDQGFSLVLERDGRDRTHAQKSGDYWGEPAELRAGKLVATAPARNLGEQPIHHADSAQRRDGEWNTIDLVCLEDASIQIVNGAVVAALLKQRNKPADGPEEPIIGGNLVLWNHGAIEFRKIEVRDIFAWPAESLPPGAWQPLFNGTDLTGWLSGKEPPLADRIVKVEEDGAAAIKITSPQSDPKQASVDATAALGDYHLRLQVKVPDAKRKGNLAIHALKWGKTMVGFRFWTDSTPIVRDYEASIKWGLLQEGRIVASKTELPTVDGPQLVPGRWHQIEVIRVGDSCLYLFDDRVVGILAQIRSSAAEPPPEKIKINLMTSYGATAFFRNIEVREIATVPPEVLAKVVAADAAPAFFNGKNLTGWEGDPKVWQVENGEIVGRNPEDLPSQHLKFNKPLRDFNIAFEARISRRGPREESKPALGFRFDGKTHVALVLRPNDPDFLCHWSPSWRGLAQFKMPVAELLKEGEYNAYDLSVRGHRLNLRVNGVAVLDREINVLNPEGELFWSLSPNIAELRIRNIRLTDLSAGSWRSLLTAPGSPPPGWWVNWDPERAARLDAAIEDGLLTIRSSGGRGALQTRAAPKQNYHLRLEFRRPVGDKRLLSMDFHVNSETETILVLDPMGGDRCRCNSDTIVAEPARLIGGKLVATGPAQELRPNPVPLSGSSQQPAGEWNRLELICLADTAVFVLNGKVHGALMNLRRRHADGREQPHVSGDIRLAVYGPAWFRNIEVRDITELPPEIIGKP